MTSPHDPCFSRTKPKTYGATTRMDGNKTPSNTSCENTSAITSTSAETMTDTEPTDASKRTNLNGREICNLVCLVLAYACVICSTTLVVGTSAVIVLSVGGSSELSPFALASFFLGSAFVSLVISPIFAHFGRKVGFMVGVGLGLLGAVLGAVAIVVKSPTLVIVASMPLGAANGIGFYLRFAAVEVVPAFFKSLAVTLVLSGGVIAAFVGPETAQATRDIFGDDLTYLGTYMMIGIFNVLDACCTLAVKFPTTIENDHNKNVEESQPSKCTDIEMHADEYADDDTATASKQVTLMSLLFQSPFFVPCAMATASWSIMAMPMSIVRVAMGDVGFTSRQSLTTIELHFLGMYGPGFITGKIIDRFGPYVTSLLSISCFLVATIINLVSDTSDNGSIATWILGLCIVGMGWNFGFSSATVLLTRVYEEAPEFKARIQAANDFFMFLISGFTTFSTGYIYGAGGGMLDGWQLVNYVVLGMIGIISAIIVPAFWTELRRAAASVTVEKGEVESLPESTSSTSNHFRSRPAVFYPEETGFELAYDFRSIHSADFGNTHVQYK